MADSKITALTALTTADPATDMFPVVDVSDTTMAASGTTKRISINNILACSPTATLASATITGAATAASLTVTGATIPANGVYLASANNLTFAFNSTLGMSLNAGGLLVNNTTGFNTVANIKLKVGGRFLSGISGIGAYSFGTADAGGFVINDAGDGSTENRLLTLNSTGLGVGVSPTGYGILALKKDNTSSPPYIVLDNRGTGASDTNTYTQGGILFGAYRDVSNPAYIASITVERKSAAGGASSTGDLIFGTAATPTTGAATERLRIDSSGNVGVGVTPSARFHSKAGAVTQGGIIETTGANALLSFADAGTSSYTRVQIGSSGNNLVALINGSTALTLNSSNSLVLGSAAIATTATDGFLYIPGCAGTPTGTPTAQTGRVPLVVDTTNNKLYFYSGGSWVAAN